MKLFDFKKIDLKNLDKEQLKYISVSSIVVVCTIMFFIFKSSDDATDKRFVPPNVAVEKARFGSVARYINAIGTLRPFDSVIIKSEVDSRIDKIYFSEGRLVPADFLLIELDASKALASLMEAEAQYKKALSEYEPIRKLVEKKIVAAVNKETKGAEVEMSRARVEMCKNVVAKHKIYAPFGGIIGLKEVSRGEFVTPGKDLVKIVDCHPMKVDFKIPESEIRHVYVGQQIKFFIDEGGENEYSAKVIAIDPESDKMSHSVDVRAIVDASDDPSSNKPEVSEEASASTETTDSNQEVASEPTDESAASESASSLKPGRFVRVRIEPDGSQNGIVIPESAIEKIGEEDTVIKITDGIATRCLVSVGNVRNGMVEIFTGINEGEIVVVAGQQGVLEGKPVTIQQAPTAKEIVNFISKAAADRKSGSSKAKNKE